MNQCLRRAEGGLHSFGYRPAWAIGWFLVFWFLGVQVFSGAGLVGAMVPNNAVVLRSDDWMHCISVEATSGTTASDCWLHSPQPIAPGATQVVRGQDYPSFRPVAYSLDAFVPFLNLNQENFWIPDAERGPVGLFGRPAGWWAVLYLQVHIMFGWAITALFAASIAGFVKKDRYN